MIIVRKAVLTDLSPLVAFGKAAIEKTNYRDLPFNSVNTRRFLKGAMDAPDMDVFIALRNGTICGVLVASADVLLFSHVVITTDLAFAAEAGGDKLLDRFIAWSKQRGAALIEMMSSQSEGYERYGRLLERKGFERSGGVFRMTLRKQETC